jgi:hypothetical protein
MQGKGSVCVREKGRRRIVGMERGERKGKETYT